MAIASINPTTGETIATFDPDDDAVIERKLAAAAAAVKQLADLGWARRRELMHAAAELLAADVDGLGETITLEMGKPLAQAKGEILKSAKALHFYADHAEDFVSGYTLDDPSIVGASRAGVRFDPLGVVLAVMPWNYPIWQVIRFAGPALMVGNPGLLKHASNVPQSALYLGDLFARAGFPEGAFQTLLIGASRVAAVIEDPRVVAVTLTGSEPAGASVARTAGGVLKKCVLELGGTDPFIVMPSADLDAAVDTAVKARTSNNGQACINAKRFILHEDIYDEFLTRFVTRMSELMIGDPLEESTDIGPVSTSQGRDDLVGLVEDAREKGAQILTGGVVPDLPGWFYPPTVVADLTPEMRLWREEAFGPVASVFRAS
ncbi:MAG TPA: aldehyde dehydrogenase family protein, partial [Pseudoclavibacter sp.]|nr:aldehyde dehydrogenase family protein [Pseudoclavibacter sp.]